MSGTNDLRATADMAGTVLTDSMRWTFSGSIADVRIKAGDISGYFTKAGQRYGSDAYFNGYGGGSINPPATPACDSVSLAANAPRDYDRLSEGAFASRIPPPRGRLHSTIHVV